MPDKLADSDPGKMSFAGGEGKPKAWKDVWDCGQGIGASKEVASAGEFVARLMANTRWRVSGRAPPPRSSDKQVISVVLPTRAALPLPELQQRRAPRCTGPQTGAGAFGIPACSKVAS